MVKEKGFSIGNIDVTLVAEQPKIAGHMAQMQENIARTAAIEKDRISIKATTTEAWVLSEKEKGLPHMRWCWLRKYRVECIFHIKRWRGFNLCHLQFTIPYPEKKSRFSHYRKGKVGMYVCGVTVYDFSHIGHARAAIVFDVIFRYLKHKGYEVTYVRNYTDVDDKIINKANKEGVDAKTIAERYITRI